MLFVVFLPESQEWRSVFCYEEFSPKLSNLHDIYPDKTSLHIFRSLNALRKWEIEEGPAAPRVRRDEHQRSRSASTAEKPRARNKEWGGDGGCMLFSRPKYEGRGQPRGAHQHVRVCMYERAWALERINNRQPLWCGGPTPDIAAAKYYFIHESNSC